MASNVISTENEEEAFLNSDKVVQIVNLLTKFKVKLWEMGDFESSDSKENEVNDLFVVSIKVEEIFDFYF